MGIHIELKDHADFYSPGDVVEGQVILHTTKKTKTKELTVSLVGKAKVHWKEKTQIKDLKTQVAGAAVGVPLVRTKTETYSAEEVYISETISLVGDGENLIHLPEGTTPYPFKFILPNNIPATFTSDVGNVSYAVKGEIKRSLFKLNDKVKQPITVKTNVDLNKEKGANLPQTFKKVKEPSLLALRKGQINLVLTLPKRSGFLPGEIIQFQVEMTNNSNQKVKRVIASLQRVGKFTAEGKEKFEYDVVSEVDGPEISPGGSETWTPENLFVPLVIPPTKLGGVCQIIDIQYILHVEMIIAGLSHSHCGQLPVIIGTVPLSRSDKKEDIQEQIITEGFPQSMKNAEERKSIPPQATTQPPRPPLPVRASTLAESETVKMAVTTPMSMPMPWSHNNQQIIFPQNHSIYPTPYNQHVNYFHQVQSSTNSTPPALPQPHQPPYPGCFGPSPPSYVESVNNEHGSLNAGETTLMQMPIYGYNPYEYHQR